MKIGFDIGGLFTKRPAAWTGLARHLHDGGATIYALTDHPDHEEAVRLVHNAGACFILADRIISCDWKRHGDRCKKVEADRLSLDFFFDDYPAYVAAAAGKCIGLMVWPGPDEGDL